MSWNMLCDFVEKGFFDSVFDDPFQAFLETKLFKFDASILPSCQNRKTWEKEGLNDMLKLFRLPYMKTAIQDDLGISVFFDTEHNQFGLSGKRVAITLNYNDRDETKDGFIQVATIENVNMDNEGAKAHVSYHMIGAYERGKFRTRTTKKQDIFNFIMDTPEDERELLRYTLLHRIVEVLYLIRPTNFVLREQPVKFKVKKRRLPRIHQKPIYTILRPNKIREIMNIENCEPGSSKTPHERSGHYRVLKHERYKENIGKHIWIKPTWIGQSESVVGNKFYKVILDEKGE